MATDKAMSRAAIDGEGGGVGDAVVDDDDDVAFAINDAVDDNDDGGKNDGDDDIDDVDDVLVVNFPKHRSKK